MPIPAVLAGGALLGSIGANMWDNYVRGRNTEDAYDTINASVAATDAANRRDIANYENLVRSTYGDNASRYEDALEQFLNSPVYQNKDFEYGKSLEDFYDPFTNQRMAAAQEALNNASASGHNRFSSSYTDAVMAKEKALQSEAWRDAYDMMMKDRATALQEYNTNSQNQWNNYNATADRARYGVDAYGNDRNSLMQGLSDATMAGMNNRTGVLQSQVNAITGLTNAQNQGSGVLSSILGPAAQFAGSYFGAQK